MEPQRATVVIIMMGVLVAGFILLQPATTSIATPANAPSGQNLTTGNLLLDAAHFLKTTSFSALLPSYSQPHRGTFGVTLGAELGDDCGGGTDTTEGIGPVIDGVSSCSACQQIAQCIGGKTGYSDAAYLWDSETGACGVGIEASASIVDSCGGADACFGIDKTRLNEIKADALAAVAAMPACYSEGRLRPDVETVLALTWVESKWDNFAGTGVYPTDMCTGDPAALATICGDPADPLNDLEFEIQQMDVDGDGSPDGRTCLDMPISADPDGSSTGLCGGKIGIGQILPSVYLDRTISSSCASGGEIHPNPWEIRDGLFAATELLAYHRKRVYDSCFTTCLATGSSSTACQSTCTGTANTCSIIDYHFGEGSCAITAEQQAFVDEIDKLKPVIRSLLDTGNCPSIGPTPCTDDERFNELRPLVDEMVPKVKELYGFVVRPEYVLAVMKIESGWSPTFDHNPILRHYYTKSPYASFAFDPAQRNAFLNTICGNPQTKAEVEAKYGAEFGRCEDMPVSSAGAMGISQFMPTTWVARIPRILELTGRSFTSPWNDRDAVAAATVHLGGLIALCGNEEMASGAYLSVGCTAPNEHYERVKTVLPTIEDLYSQTCTVPTGDTCPLVMPPFPPTPPTTGCLFLTGDFCPSGGCACYTGVHEGVDIVGQRAEPIYAVYDGTIIDVIAGCATGSSWGCGDGWGNHVVLKDKDSNFHVLYAHLLDIFVSPGNSVGKGQLIGHVDDSGSSLGDHLHFEVNTTANPRSDDAGKVDPRSYFSCIPQACGTQTCPAEG